EKNKKTDKLQKLTTQLVKDYDTICIPDQDTSRGEIIQLLRYKSNWYGKTLIEEDKVRAGSPEPNAYGEQM
ncbi:MAG: hypothetical protein LBD23_20505, partial [Oscillospiraceae bacterium]|nr:hypothetical protein [Oscillospiraceae bacterium]